MNLALILITHDLGIVARMADRVAVMYGGRIVETAHAKACLRAPRIPIRAACSTAFLHAAAARGSAQFRASCRR